MKHYTSDHPRYCSPARWEEIKYLGKPPPGTKRPTRRMSFSHPPVPLDRVLFHRKRKATIALKNAFLDLNAARARNEVKSRNMRFAAAIGKDINPDVKLEDMEPWLNRHRDALAARKAVFSPSF